MTYLPSERLSILFAKSRAGFWIERIMGGRHALVGKMPEATIKALVRGARSALLISIVKVEQLNILCIGLRVEDEPEHPFSVITPDMLPGGLLPLRKILSSDRTTLHCVNELDHPVLSAWAALESSATRNALNSLNSLGSAALSPAATPPFPVPELERMGKLALDQFQRHIYSPTDEDIPDHILMTGRIGLELSLWTPTEVFEVSSIGGGGPFRIDDPEEGQKQERSLHLIVNAIYPGRSYRSPTVGGKDPRRELTDILAFADTSLCLIQSKAAGVLSGNLAQPAERRKATMTKHVMRALKQLGGALKSIRSDKEVFDEAGDLIVVPNRKTALAHAIVVLSELYFFLDWRAITRLLVELSENEAHRALYHVIDVQELAYVAANRDDSHAFSNLMIQRWAAVKARGTAYLRVTFPES